MKRADVEAVHRRLDEHLRRNGLKQTRQREQILDVFLTSPGHVTSEQLHELVRLDHPDVGAATVYRTLHLLCDAGIAHAHRFGDGVTIYELEGRHHDHLMCTECGKITEFSSDLIESEQERIAKKMGFRVTRHQHILFGQCADCREPVDS